MLRSVWKNVIGIVVVFGIVFLIAFSGFKIGFSVFDFTKTILNNPISIVVFLTLLNIIIAFLFAFLIIYVINNKKRKKQKLEV